MIRIRRHRTEFGYLWKVKIDGEARLLGLFRKGDDAIAHVHKELSALDRKQAQRDRTGQTVKAFLDRLGKTKETTDGPDESGSGTALPRVHQRKLPLRSVNPHIRPVD